MGIFKGRRSRRQPKVCYIRLGLSENPQKPVKQAGAEALTAAEQPALAADAPEQAENEERP